MTMRKFVGAALCLGTLVAVLGLPVARPLAQSASAPDAADKRWLAGAPGRAAGPYTGAGYH